ncbi:PEP-CTERM sorting domain-containing protein [Methylophilus medardicus]|uniref:PEP-CTERM sorting domain-containing protein n=1 Tax=Methylophilus medardicus TaxID=2588534 RepID=A0A5B8CR53_9PROT|nr:PEP-CTERM sorting domain-containing protein [Methylophilus medardicus]QDC43506.1 PEP-CTERM sorting domain-containing protein [Methylophilus medardicus]QDC48513.1 PEP-CTERM sorting domain-containing protein [Methylophilus medardicus]QDC52218.1 PEP-CTERM sorting domain-containing protein [Methylophilus medardicus]
MFKITNLKTCLIGAYALSFFSLTANAALISYTSGGKDLVYSSISDVTWTKDANLLGSMIAVNGYDAVVNAIIHVTPTVASLPNYDAPTGLYTLSQSDFVDGYVSWYGAVAFANYLNSIQYGGSNRWQLPSALIPDNSGCTTDNSSTACVYDAIYQGNGVAPGNELAELYFHELGGRSRRIVNGGLDLGTGMPQTIIFDNENDNPAFATSTEVTSNGNTNYYFDTRNGLQLSYLKGGADLYYAWAITPGLISAVPEPESLGILMAGLGLIGLIQRRRRLSS